MMTPTTFLWTVCLCLLTSQILAQSQARDAMGDADGYLDAVANVRRAVDSAHGGTPSKAADAVRAIEAIAIRPDAHGYAVFESVKCRLLMQSKETDKAKSELMRLLDLPAIAPECMAGLIEINGDDVYLRTELEDCLAKLLPLSGWADSENARRNPLSVFTNPPRPSVPSSDPKRMVQIAEAFEAAGLPECAWRAYIEAIYDSAPSWVGGPPDEEAWFSPDTAPLWRRAAANAWMAGEHDLAYSYLAKAAIFGDEAELGEAREMVQQWKEAKPTTQPHVSQEQRRASMEQVLELYRRMNAHPRALSLIQEHKGLFDKPDELYEKYAAKWKALVRAYHSRDRSFVVLYGVKVTEGVDPASIRIPWACSPEALKAVKASAAKILEKPADAKKPNSVTHTASRPSTTNQ